MRKINRAVKIRIYPNKEQITQIEKTIGCSRFLYNRMLADKIRYYQEEKKMLKNMPAGYKKEYPWLKEVDSLALANVQLNLEGAFRKFFQEPGVGFPHYKSKAGGLHFGKGIQDNGYGQFLSMLGYKLEERGKYLIKVDRYFASSKICSVCGHKKKELALSERIYLCECGNRMDRDVNAAVNILKEGKRIYKKCA